MAITSVIYANDLPIASFIGSSDYVITINNGILSRTLAVDIGQTSIGYRLSTVEITSDYTIASSDSGAMLTYTGVSAITAYITNALDVAGFNTSVAQLSTGTVEVRPSPAYSASLVAYGDLFITAGPGAMASIIRTSEDAFLLSGLLQ